ncbi:MAG TPA: hypothetical protein VLA26_06565 [Gammaproteobacteria bacterium]|nr:hypothetical protein [Gammaproteobacteria bacterium]
MESPIRQWWQKTRNRPAEVHKRFSPELLADRNPRFYRMGLELVAGIGLAFMYGLPLLALGLGLFLTKLLLTPSLSWNSPAILLTGTATVVLAWACVELWRLRPELPEGVEVSQEDAPRLHAMVKRRVEKFSAPAIDRVLLTPTANIEVVSTPLTGYRSGHEHSLCIGVPLLHLLNHKQLRVKLHCVIGQHACYRDPRAGRLVRLRRDWESYSQALRGHTSPGAWVLRAFTAWYNPMLQEWSCSAAREHALQHDQYAIDLVKDIELLAMIAAEAVCAAYLERCFWPLLMKTADRQPNPTLRPFSNFEPILRSTLQQQDAERWLIKALLAREESLDPSPKLAQRLDTLGYAQLHFFSLPDQGAMSGVLGRKMQELLKELDQQWRNAINSAWRARHQAFRDEKARFDNLHERFEANLLEGPAAFAYARLVSKFLPTEQCIRIYTTLLERDQDNPEVLFEMGKLLLDTGEISGVRAIELAIGLDKSYVGRASAALSEFTTRRKLGVERLAPERPVDIASLRIHAA